MIIYGSQMYGKKNIVEGWGFCEHCGNYGRHRSYDGRKWGHIYFIPLIPVGGRARVLKECRSCSTGTHVPEAEVPTMLEEMRRTVDDATAALMAGETEFEHDGTMVPCAACVASAIVLLYCMGAEDYVRVVLAGLEEDGLAYAYHLANGESLEFHGQLQAAADSYRQAAECEPDDPLPLISIGTVYLKQGDHASARPVYEQALGLTDEKFSVLEMLITVYEALKDHDCLAEAYEQCFQLVPELTRDKKVVKAYRSACRKAGREPVQ